MAVFELAEAGFGVGLGTVGGDHLGGGPVVAVGEQEPLAKDLVSRRRRAVALVRKPIARAGGAWPVRVTVSTRCSQRGPQDLVDLGLHGIAVLAGAPAGKAGLQPGELAARLGQGLLEAAGLAYVEGGVSG